MKLLPKRLLIGGLILSIGAPMAGLLFTVIGMIGAFNTLRQQGISNPQALSTQIGTVLVATWAGLVVGLAIGLPLVITALVLHFSAQAAPKPPPPFSGPIS
jgi:biopolymer transport protein ExbB/TolQ